MVNSKYENCPGQIDRDE